MMRKDTRQRAWRQEIHGGTLAGAAAALISA
jgi:hypothetical protein